MWRYTGFGVGGLLLGISLCSHSYVLNVILLPIAAVASLWSLACVNAQDKRNARALEKLVKEQGTWEARYKLNQGEIVRARSERTAYVEQRRLAEVENERLHAEVTQLKAQLTKVANHVVPPKA